MPIKLTLLWSALLDASVAATSAPAAELLYANNADASAVESFSGSLYALTPGGPAISALASNDAAGRLYVGFGAGGTIAQPANNLYTYDYSGKLLISTRTGNTSRGGTSGSVSFNSFTDANGNLYGVYANGTTAQGGIDTINPTTGDIALAGSLFVSGGVSYNFQDLDYDEANGRFLAVNTAVSGTGGSAAGLYSVELPATPSGLATVTLVAALPGDAPAGNATPDGLAFDDTSGIVYFTYNRTGTISRYSVTSGSYLLSLTGPGQTQGASGDATFATGFVPEPGVLAAVLPALALLRRRRA